MYDDDYSKSTRFDPERANAEFLKAVIGTAIGAILVFCALFAVDWVCRAAGWVADAPVGVQTPTAQTTDHCGGQTDD